MKLCHTCQTKKPLKDFPVHNSKKGTRHTQCRVCRSKNARKYYQDNKGSCDARNQKNRKISRLALLLFIKKYLEEHPCVDCGEKDIVVLEFDHRNPSTKLFHIANAISWQYSVEATLKEVEKCDVRCANCHRRATASKYGHWRYQMSVATG